ncbi:MAG: peptidoglycan-N-acetylmuramate O-acetyltransferase [Acidimicrobiales bacterium]|nr:peptidoglycan-N-acetylmuramate O-acetyltransferase [Acidimicrobiales bacterium]
MVNRRLARLIAIGLVAVLAVTLLAGLVAATAGPGRRIAAPPGAARKRVLIIGDSVMQGAAPQFPLAMPDRQVTVDALVNRSTIQGVDVANRHGTGYDVVVVQLGTNDGGSMAVYQPRVEKMLAALANVPLVIWLTIREVRPYYGAANNLIRSLLPTHPNLAVGDWNAVANQHPEVFSGDGLHLKGQGPNLMAFFVANLVSEIRAGDNGLPPPTTAAPTTVRATTTTRRERAAEPRTVLPASHTKAEPPVTTSAHRDRSRRRWAVAAGAVALAAAAFAIFGRTPGPSRSFRRKYD